MGKEKVNRLIVNGIYVIFILSFLFIVSEVIMFDGIQPVIKRMLLIALGVLFGSTTIMYYKYLKLSFAKHKNIVNELESITAKENDEESIQNEDARVESEIQEETKNYLDIDLNKIIPSNKNIESKTEFCNALLVNLSKQIELVKGIVYIKSTNAPEFLPLGTYAYYDVEAPRPFIEGEGLPGQVVRDKKPIYLTDIPEKYLNVVSGLGTGNPKYLLLIPLVINDVALGILELASFKPLNLNHELIITTLSDKLVNIVNKLK